MSERNCGNCRFFRPSEMLKPDADGMCDFVLPDYLKKYDDDSSMRRMHAKMDYCSFHKRKKVR